MPSFDQPSAEVAATTEAALDSHCQEQPLTRVGDLARTDREELAAMLLELQTNRGILAGVTSWYGLFVFTGGDVPTAQWNLAAITSYLEHPLATGCLLTSEIQRYRRLVQTLGGLGQSGTRPRTLRCRYEMGHKFQQAASEIRALTDALESSVMKALEALPLPRSE